jgi:hypothetical protein
MQGLRLGQGESTTESQGHWLKGGYMYKVVNPGKVLIGKQLARVFCKIKIEDGKLTISGVEGPLHNGDARGGCGQINPLELDLSKLTNGWTVEKMAKFNTIWKHWHLNDNRAWCEHQRDLWKLDEDHPQIELTELKWSDKFYETMKRAEGGSLNLEEYQKYCEIYPIIDRLVTGIDRPKHLDCWGIEGEQMISAGWIELGKKELKNRGCVKDTEHPEGILCKPCPVCGYKYGTEWRKEELPADVVEFLEDLPETTVTPAWV